MMPVNFPYAKVEIYLNFGQNDESSTYLGRNDFFKIGRNRPKIGSNGFWVETIGSQRHVTYDKLQKNSKHDK